MKGPGGAMSTHAKVPGGPPAESPGEAMLPSVGLEAGIVTALGTLLAAGDAAGDAV